jgi:starch synthase
VVCFLSITTRTSGLLITGADQSALEFYGHLSFMKAALVHAKRVNTVSPTYAREICTPEFGWGLDGLLRDRGGQSVRHSQRGRLFGMGSEQRPALPRGYTADKLRGKKDCKLKLQAELGFAVRGKAPLFAVVSRLTSQKGMDLVLGACRNCGSGRATGRHRQWRSRDRKPASGPRPRLIRHTVSVHLGYDDALAHRIMAGCRRSARSFALSSLVV